MGTKSCCVGILLCLGLLAVLFGIDGVARHLRNRRQHRETAQYNNPANCTVRSGRLRRGRKASGSSCLYAHYLLEYHQANGTTAPNLSPAFQGIRQSFSNFYDRECGGMILPQLLINGTSAIGAIIPCWYAEPDDTRLRVGPIIPVQMHYIVYGVSLLVVGGLPLLIFMIYNFYLCGYACCRDPNDYDADGRPRGRPARRVFADAGPVGSPQVGARTRSEPFEIADADDDDDWTDRFTGNSYAAVVIGKIQRVRQRRRLRAEAKRKAAEAEETVHAADVDGTGEERGPAITVTASEPCTASPTNGTDPEAIARRRAAVAAVLEAHHRRGATPMASTALSSCAGTPRDGDVNIEECLVCFEAVVEAIVLYPCGHFVCDSCAANLLTDSFYGVVQRLRCPQCRAEAEDSSLIRVRLLDGHVTPAVISVAPTPAAGRERGCEPHYEEPPELSLAEVEMEVRTAQPTPPAPAEEHAHPPAAVAADTNEAEPY